LLNWPADFILGTPEADLVDDLKAMTLVECPVLLRSEMFLEDPTEETRSYLRRGETFSERVTCYTLVVPFTGVPSVFRMRAHSRNVSPPRAKLSSGTGPLRIEYDKPSGSAEIRAHFDRVLDEIDQHLTWAREDIRQFQWGIEQELPRLVSERRAKLLADRQTHASIGFPIKRRSDAATHAVPVRRTRLVPKRAAQTRSTATPFKSEPALAEDDYEDALAVLRNARNALERTPSVQRG
jgi:hypothetical protein